MHLTSNIGYNRNSLLFIKTGESQSQKNAPVSDKAQISITVYHTIMLTVEILCKMLAVEKFDFFVVLVRTTQNHKDLHLQAPMVTPL